MTVLFFPWLHDELVKGPIPGGITFLDPGVAPSDSRVLRWRPPDLPLEERAATRYTQESLRFGEQFRTSSELAYFSAGKLEDFYSQTSQSIRTQFSRRESSAGADSPTPALRGQMMLLLLWTLEEKVIEYLRLSEQFQEMGQAFQASLGLEEPDEEARPPLPEKETRGTPHPLPHWTKILPWFVYWMRDGDGLFIRDRDIVREWRERGLSLQPVRDGGADPGFDPRGVADLYRAEVTGRDAAFAETDRQGLPWLDRQFSVYCCEEKSG